MSPNLSRVACDSSIRGSSLAAIRRDRHAPDTSVRFMLRSSGQMTASLRAAPLVRPILPKTRSGGKTARDRANRPCGGRAPSVDTPPPAAHEGVAGGALGPDGFGVLGRLGCGFGWGR